VYPQCLKVEGRSFVGRWCGNVIGLRWLPGTNGAAPPFKLQNDGRMTLLCEHRNGRPQ
jgi:hypothetical protein